MMPGRRAVPATFLVGSDGLILPFADANFCKHVEITAQGIALDARLRLGEETWPWDQPLKSDEATNRGPASPTWRRRLRHHPACRRPR
jgi:hypothetical protein